MKVDDSSLKKLAIEFKIAIKSLFSGDQSKLSMLLMPYNDIESEYILSQFDRYGNHVEYEKSGLRVVNLETKEVEAFKFGYTSKLSAQSGPSEYHILRINHLNAVKKTKIVESVITYPSTDKLIDAFRIIIAKNIFKKPLNEVIVYAKVRRLKILIDKVSESGFNQDLCKELNELFESLSVPQRNKILSMFDTVLPMSSFKGIRYETKYTPPYHAIDMRGQKCKFKYNSLHLRKTAEIIERWMSVL